MHGGSLRYSKCPRVDFLPALLPCDSAIEAILEPLPTDTCLDSFATLTLFRFGSLKIVPQLWNIQIKAKDKDKARFCDAIEQIQKRDGHYNPEFC